MHDEKFKWYKERETHPPRSLNRIPAFRNSLCYVFIFTSKMLTMGFFGCEGN